MANLISIVGPSGTGKSSSIEKLNPKETYIINILGKPLPFKGSGGTYNVENKNTAAIDKWNEVSSLIQGISNNRPDILTIVIDDANYIMSTEFLKRASENGFSKFSEIGQHMFNVVDTAKKLRSDLNVVFTFHDEFVDTGMDSTPLRKIKTVGKLLDNSWTLEGLFTVLLYTKVEYDKDGEPSYHFITNHQPNIPSKTPKGMFEDIKIDNDLQYVIKKVTEYYA